MKTVITNASGFIWGIFALISFIMTGCSDEKLNLRNELGSTLKEEGNFKVSSFIINEKYWNIPDTSTNLNIRLTSHTDSSVREYSAMISKDEDEFSCRLQIPKDERIPDSDYDLSGTLADGKPLGSLLKVTFRDEMLHILIGSEMEYTLYGNGTEDKPYQIGSKDDFDQFEYDLSRDSINHGAGIYFKQTADFEAPPRSDAYQGRYYAGYLFAGVYDGGHHSISLPYIGSMEGDDVSIGLFKALCNGALIKNLTVKPRMTGIKSNGGALAGTSQGNVKISDVTIDGSITNCGSSIGGFIGSATGKLIIENCHLYAEINGEDNIGGVVGSVEEGELQIDGLSNLREDYNTALFTVNSTKSNAGGIAGSIINGGCQFRDITLQHSISEQDVNLKVIYSGDSNCGGLIGEAKLNKSGSIRGVKVLAPVRSEKDNVGGLIGYADLSADLSVQNTTVGSLVKGNNNIGGFFGSMKSNKHLILEGHDNTNRIGQVDNGYIAVEGECYVGGMFGYLENDIQAKAVSVINVNVTAHSNFGGGIIGKNHNNTLECKYFTLDPDMHVQGPDAIGGLVGYAEWSTIKGRIEGDLKLSPLPASNSFKSDFAGTVSSGNDNPGNGTSMGGIVGYAQDTYISQATCTGKVFGKERVGGIVGHVKNSSRGEVKNCVANMSAVKNSQGNYTGGIIGRLAINTGGYNHLLNYGKIEGSNYTGGIVGHVSHIGGNSDITIEYAVNLGEVTGSNVVGGCVGLLVDDSKNNHRILNSANYGKISNSSQGNIGGIIGQGDAPRMIVMYCANHGEVAGGSGDSKVGGIAGRLGKDPTGAGFTKGENMEMAYCCNRGKVSSGNGNSHVGGLLGYQEEGNDYDDTHWMTHDCYNTGEVTSDQKSDNGGIVGCVDHYAEVVRCINIGKVSYGNAVVGTHHGSIWHHHDLYYLEGSGKGWCASSFSDSKKKEKGTFSGFNFDTDWAIDDKGNMNNGFPYLKNCPFQSVYK